MVKSIENHVKAVAASIVICAAGACATQGSGLEAVKSRQQHELYKGCIDTQMKQAAYGHGLEVHQACLAWVRRQL